MPEDQRERRYGQPYRDVRADFRWYPFKHFGFGAGYNWVRVAYTDISSKSVEFEYTCDGAIAYATHVL